MKYRIAHVIEDYSTFGGTQRVVSNLSTLFICCGYVVPLVISFKKKSQDSFYDFGLDTDFLSLDRRSQTIIVDINNMCDMYKIDFIIFHGYHLLFFIKGLRDIHQLKCKFILRTAFSSQNFLKPNYLYPFYRYFFHNSKKYIAFYSRWKYYYKFRLKKILEHGFIVCVSASCTNELQELFKEYSHLQHKIVHIYNPLVSYPIEKKCIDKDKVIVYSSRLRQNKKNSILIFKMWERVYKSFPDWHLLVLGEGEAMPLIKKFVLDRQINNIHFLGSLQNVQTIYCKSSIAVCSSNSDALPQSIVEAARYQNAIVTTEFDGGVKEIVSDGINGYIVPKNNYKLFAKKLMRIMEDESLRLLMGSHSFDLSLKFNPEGTLKSWSKLFNQIK